MVATLVEEEDQRTLAVTSWTVPSLKVPVAVHCCVTPAVTVAESGAMAMDCNVAEVTAMALDGLEMPVKDAEICVAPADSPVALPPELMMPTACVAEAHVT